MKKLTILVVVLAVITALAVAQDAPKETPKETFKPFENKPLGSYKLEFALRELRDAKLINTRNYMMTLDDSNRFGEVKIGSRVPVSQSSNNSAMPNTFNYNYLDVGTNIRCRAQSQSPNVALDCTIEISSFSLPEEKIMAGRDAPPVLNQIRLSIPAVVPEGKQTVMGVIDDPNSTKHYEIAVTATKLK